MLTFLFLFWSGQLFRRSSWPSCGFSWSSSSSATWPSWWPWACPARASHAWITSSSTSPSPVKKINFNKTFKTHPAVQICYNSGPHLIKTDLSVGVISVLTDIVWKITVAWHAGNIACKVIRFSQVRLRVSIRPNSCATSCLYSRRDFLSFWLGDLFCSLCTSDKQNWSRGTCSSPTFVVVTKKKRKEKKRC